MTRRSRLGLRVAPLCGLPEHPSNVARMSHFAAPRDGEVLIGSASGPIARAPPAALESGDSLPPRCPPGMTMSRLGLLGAH
eukprot:8718241-Pyramimonas_sp.AAC.1